MTHALTVEAIHNFADDIQDAIVEARRLFEQSDFTVEKKADGSPVTSIDTAIQKVLKDICQRYLGDSIHFVSEEVEDGEILTSPDGKRFWVFIDPIDGTTPLCAGDPQNACIAVGVFRDGKPYLGFVAKLGDLSIIYGGTGLGEVVFRQANGLAGKRKVVSPSNQMCCIDLSSGTAANALMSQFILAVVADRTLGGYPYNVPSIAAALKLIEGHSKFFIGSNSKPWDVAAILPLLPILGYSIQSLETGEPISLDGSRVVVPAFVMSTSQAYSERLVALYNRIRLSV